jgi:peptide/nickel transport system substrate-binding protein
MSVPTSHRPGPRAARWLLAAAVLLAPALAPGPAPARTPPGVLVVGQVAEPKSLDPGAVTALNDFRILVNLYDGLVRYRPGTLDIAPALATDWSVSPDGTVYTFHLREGVAFHDGTPFDARAVTFTFDRMLDPEHPQHGTGPFPLADFFFGHVREVTAVDPRTVRFRLDAPYAPFLSNLAYPTALIVSPAAVREHGADFGRHPSGTGPFRFERWDANRRVVVARNDAYWGGAPKLDAVVFRPLTDPNTRVTEMLSGGLDLMLEVPPDHVATFRDDDRFRLLRASGPHLWFLILNTREGPFADVRVRRAVGLAIDRKALVEQLLQGNAAVATGVVPAAFAWAHDPDLPPTPHDPDRARALIREAGQAGAEVTFAVAEGGSGMLDPVPMGTAIQADLARVGLKVKIQTYEWNTYLRRVNGGLAGTADMAEMAWMTNDPDTLPHLALRSDAWPEQGGFNSGYYANPKVDRLLEEARRTTDRERRGRLYRRMERIVQADAPWAVVASGRQTAVITDRVDGFALEPSFSLLLRRVTKR